MGAKRKWNDDYFLTDLRRGNIRVSSCAGTSSSSPCNTICRAKCWRVPSASSPLTRNENVIVSTPFRAVVVAEIEVREVVGEFRGVVGVGERSGGAFIEDESGHGHFVGHAHIHGEVTTMATLAGSIGATCPAKHAVSPTCRIARIEPHRFSTDSP